jgi:hypothetical protein
MWAQFAAVFSFTLLLAAYAKQGSNVALKAAGIFIGLVLLDVFGNLVEFIGYLRPLNIITYNRPGKIMIGQGHFWRNSSVLMCFCAACIYISLRRFNRRDIP